MGCKERGWGHTRSAVSLIYWACEGVGGINKRFQIKVYFLDIEAIHWLISARSYFLWRLVLYENHFATIIDPDDKGWSPFYWGSLGTRLQCHCTQGLRGWREEDGDNKDWVTWPDVSCRIRVTWTRGSQERSLAQVRRDHVSIQEVSHQSSRLDQKQWSSLDFVEREQRGMHFQDIIGGKHLRCNLAGGQAAGSWYKAS